MILTSKGSCFTLGIEKDVKYDPYSSLEAYKANLKVGK